MKRLLGAEYRRAPVDADRRPARRQRVHHLHHRHVGQHGQLRVAADAAQDAGSARRLPDGEGLAGHERRGRLHVPVLSRHAGCPTRPRSASSCSTACATGFRSATRARSRASSRRSAPTIRPGDASACTSFGDEFTGASVDSVVRTVDIINREDRTGERRVRIHALGVPGAARRAAVHERPLRDADAGALRTQRRHLRRVERTRQLQAVRGVSWGAC